MKTAYLSPLPPVRSGVSEYSADLLPQLATQLDLAVFAEAPAAAMVGALPVGTPEDFDRGFPGPPIYHLGNNLHHRFIHERARKRPGIVVLHDLVLHHYYIEETLAKGDSDGYVDLMTEIYGQDGAAVARARVNDASTELSYFHFPLFEPVARRSLAAIVHNARSARLLRARIPDLPVAVVPMGIPATAKDPLPERTAARRERGLAANDFVVGLFGFTTPIKRPLAVLEAFASSRARLGPGARLVVIGEVSRALDLAAAAMALGIRDCVILTDYLPYPEVKGWVAAADVFVNLRYPSAGETSASLLRLLGWGKPVIVSDYAQFRELPGRVALKVSLGRYEVAELAEYLALLRGTPAFAARLGVQASEYVAAEHTLASAASGYAEVVREVSAMTPGWSGIHRLSAPDDRRGLRLGRPRARLSAPALPSRIVAGAKIAMTVTVRNDGDQILRRRGAGRAVVGGYFRHPDGRVLAEELRWGGLSRDLAPGDETTVDWVFEVPEIEGAVELIVDLKIAGWSWLLDQGSEALAFPLEIAR